MKTPDNRNQQPVTLLIDMSFSPQQLDSAVKVLMFTVGPTESKPGCLECVVAKDVVEKSHVRYTTSWSTESAFHRYVKTEEFRRILVAIDMCSEEPRVTVGNLSERSGMDCLKELLASGETGTANLQQLHQTRESGSG